MIKCVLPLQAVPVTYYIPFSCQVKQKCIANLPKNKKKVDFKSEFLLLSTKADDYSCVPNTCIDPNNSIDLFIL